MHPNDLASTLLDSSPDGLLLVDALGTIVLANQTATEIFGHPLDKLTGMSVDDLVPAERRKGHAGLRARYAVHPTRRPMGTGLQLLAEHADGSLFPVEISLSPVRHAGIDATIATVRDVSERQADIAQMALLRDRERIARDIHDMVIQRLFAAGMSLQAVAGAARPPHVAERIVGVIEELDGTIRELRSAIFQLSLHDAQLSVSDRITAVVDERAKHLGFQPDLHLEGEFDDLGGDVAEQLIATLGEALSNVVRHAEATAVSVEVVSDDRIQLRVIDDGIGLAGSRRQHGGISNMTYRASALGGSCTVEPRPEGGTLVDWSVPLRAASESDLAASS